MAKAIFYPVGNGDSTLIHLADGRLLLVDFNCLSGEVDDGRVSLDVELRSYLAEQGRDYLDLVAFTHADVDHVCGAEECFWFEHAQKYQGEERVRIGELVVPACLILEAGLTGSAGVIRAEARYRLKQGAGIRVNR